MKKEDGQLLAAVARGLVSSAPREILQVTILTMAKLLEIIVEEHKTGENALLKILSRLDHVTADGIIARVMADIATHGDTSYRDEANIQQAESMTKELLAKFTKH